MKPFIFVDVDSMELIFVINTIVKRIKISEIDQAEDFIDEFYRRFKDINFVPKYNCINRKEFMDLVNGLKKQEETEKKKFPETEKDIIPKCPDIAKSNTGKSQQNSTTTESTIVRSNTERKIAVEDLEMRFDEPYDYYDLSLLDQEKVKKSNQLKYFLDKGFLVYTTFDEVSQMRDKMINAKEELKKKRQAATIVNRKDIVGDDKGVLISSEQYRSAKDDSVEELVEDENIDLSDADSLIQETFSKNVAIDKSNAKSVDDLLRKT